jgi:hypothetical protein
MADRDPLPQAVRFRSQSKQIHVYAGDLLPAVRQFTLLAEALF